MANPVGYSGRGSQLLYASDGVTYVALAQITRITPEGSKQQFVDQTNIGSPGGFTQPLATNVDAGEISIEGILNPADTSFQNLGVLHGAMTLCQFQIVLPDGVGYGMGAYVSEYVPFAIDVRKPLTFSAKLRIVGGLYSPLTAFDPVAFDPAAFSIIQI